MGRIAIQPPDMKDHRPRYTHGWRVGNTIYVAGQLAYDKDATLVGPNDIKTQARQVLNNLKRVVETGGVELARELYTAGYDRIRAAHPEDAAIEKEMAANTATSGVA